MSKNVNLTVFLLFVVLVIVSLVSLYVGVYQFEFGIIKTIKIILFNPEILNSTDFFVLMQLRLPRIFLAVIIGAGLALSGTAIQGVFKNPLATPDLIGITSGAVFFAAITIVFNSLFAKMLSASLQYSILSIMAFIGALLATLLVYKIATYNGKTQITILLLSGVAISALVGAGTGLLTFLSTEEQLQNLTFWTLGSLAGTNWHKVVITAVVTLLCSSVLVKKGKILNALQLGETEAQHIGFQVQKTKKQIILATSLIVGTCVAFTGTIGFIGLIVPYILRLIYQANYIVLLPLSLLLGSIILVIADTVARILVAPSELPIGIITAFMGAPVFITLLVKNKKQLS
ncbi:FecCD family ABC transporter permease [Flavobacterium agricola]|nr:iron ABC transporter permease [Flavobacterium agricola]